MLYPAFASIPASRPSARLVLACLLLAPFLPARAELMLDNEDKPLLPARLEVVDDRTARLTITEGRYHQVRRMFAAVGNHVVTLHRERIGGIALPDDLAPGQHRILPATEAEQVFADV